MNVTSFILLITWCCLHIMVMSPMLSIVRICTRVLSFFSYLGKEIITVTLILLEYVFKMSILCGHRWAIRD